MSYNQKNSPKKLFAEISKNSSSNLVNNFNIGLINANRNNYITSLTDENDNRNSNNINFEENFEKNMSKFIVIFIFFELFLFIIKNICSFYILKSYKNKIIN